MRLNNSSLANYDSIRMLAVGATVSATEQLAQTSGIIGLIPAASASSTLMGGHTIWLPHYTNAARVKLAHSHGFDSHSTTIGALSVGAWGFHHSGLTAAVNRITLFPAAGSFTADSVATLYGLPT
jgi:hypothetical protein